MKRKKPDKFNGLAKNKEGLTFSEWYEKTGATARHPTAAAYEAWRNGIEPHVWFGRRGIS